MLREQGMSRDEMLDNVDPTPGTVSLKEQLREALQDVKRLKAQVGDDEALFGFVRNSINALEPYRRVPIPKPQLKHAPSDAALILCDAHSEEVVRAEEVEGLASYNWETFERRMRLTAEKTVELVNIMRQAGQVKTLRLWLLGDWFLGEIHPQELGFGTSMPLPHALPKASRALADLVLRLAAYFDAVDCVGIVGNHGRTTIKPASKMAADRNWDYALYLIAQEFTKRDVRVRWTIPQSKIHVVETMGWKVALTHGDVCRRTHTHSYFGISQAIAKERQTRRRTEKDFDYAFMGHWHHYGILEHDTMICPPMIGHSQFAQYVIHSRTQAQQMLTFFTEKHGRTCSWPINLEVT
jgi:hypothetical protein